MAGDFSPRHGWLLRVSAAAALWFAPGLSLAADERVEPPVSREAQLLNPFRLERPARTSGIAELGLAWLTLPGAEVCEASACSSGDTTPLVELWNLVRFEEVLAVGAGVTLGLIPTTDVAPNPDRGIVRDHARSYMTIEALARYYPPAFVFADLWLGGGGGLVILSDTFDTVGNLDVYAPIGNPGVTIRSEGLSVFGGLGITQKLADHLNVGIGGRVGIFNFPGEPARSPLGDRASIAGLNGYFTLGLNVGLEADL